MTTTLDPVFGAIPDAPPPLIIDAPPSINASTTTVGTVTGTVTKTDPALGLLTPAFWALIEERASVLPQRDTEGDTDYEKRLRRVVTCSVLLTEIGDALGIPADYTRAYLRAIHSRLEALGVKLRERRLTADGDLSSQFWSVVGEFVSPADRQAAYHARGAAKRAVAEAKARIAGGDKSPAATKALNDANVALEESENAITENDAMSTHLPTARHAYAVVIDQSLYC